MALFDMNSDVERGYFYDVEECKKNAKVYKQTNPKYKKFDQSYYTAGDFADFNKYGILEYMTHLPKEQILSSTVLSHKQYHEIDYESIFNTYNYISNEIKKGIFVIISGGELICYLPLSKYGFKPPYVKETFLNEKEKELLSKNPYAALTKPLNQNLSKFILKIAKQPMNFNREQWVANNCWFSSQWPTYEGDLNYGPFKVFLEQLVAERSILDCVFFLNVRDFPIYNKDFTHPYNHLYEIPPTIPIGKNKMCPIFSQSIYKGKSADLIMPTADDISRVLEFVVPSRCNDQYLKFRHNELEYNWVNKKEIAIFRGCATGCGITSETNPRLKIVDLSKEYPDLLDAGIVDYNAKPKKYKGGPLQVIDKSKYKLSNKITNAEKSKHKYIVCIDGSVVAFRLGFELCMNSVVLLGDSDYEVWYSKWLRPFKEFVPVKADLSDLIEKIQWCKDNDKECQKIAKCARKFYDKYLSKEGMFDYMQDMLSAVAANMVVGQNALCLPPFLNRRLKVAIICPYRDAGDGLRKKQREQHLQIFNSGYYNSVCDADFYIVTQCDGDKFNIGKMKNIGFELAMSRDNYDMCAFTDIDSIPDRDLLQYYNYLPEAVMMLSIRGTRYDNQGIFYGSIVIFNSDMFKQMNGYPNNFWGWGGEDSALSGRLEKAGAVILNSPKKGQIIDLENYVDFADKKKSINNEMENAKVEKLINDSKICDINGLNSVDYKTIEIIEGDKFTEIIVDPLKNNDIHAKVTNTVHDYDKLKKIMWDKFKNIESRFKIIEV